SAETLKAGFIAVINVIKTSFISLISFFSSIGSAITAIFGTAIEGMKSKFSALGSVFSGVGTLLAPVVSFIGNSFSSIG
ncbi:hypothetical protein OFM41_33875, partial [Escherichia coli]|nr:hypothetical protein [Escherichia coli]